MHRCGLQLQVLVAIALVSTIALADPVTGIVEDFNDNDISDWDQFSGSGWAASVSAAARFRQPQYVSSSARGSCLKKRLAT